MDIKVMTKIAKYIFITIVTFLVYMSGFMSGYKNTHISNLEGYNEAIDTVLAIVKDAVKSDSNHCTFICIDTSKYYLSHKKICK